MKYVVHIHIEKGLEKVRESKRSVQFAITAGALERHKFWISKKYVTGEHSFCVSELVSIMLIGRTGLQRVKFVSIADRLNANIEYRKKYSDPFKYDHDWNII